MKARAGNKHLLHRSGQSMIEDKVPKSGFHRKRLQYKTINIEKLQEAITSGRLQVPEDRPLNVKDLFDTRLLTLRQVSIRSNARCQLDA